MRNIVKTALTLWLVAFSALSLQAQVKTVTVTGNVADEQGEPLIGVNVVVKNQPGFGVITDLDGNYTISAGVNDVLIFTYVGFQDLEIPINGQAVVNAVMTAGEALEEAVVVAGGYQRKVSVVGSVASVKMDDIKVPTSSISNSLAGNVPGIIAVQRTGEPGKDASEFWIRGISTFGANSSALVLVDGIERNFNEINVEDIESFSVLKDASATAVYGQRGANGVVLITTKKGKEGKVDINFKGEYGISQNAYDRQFVDAETYARLANEARQSRYMDPVYDDSELEIIKYGLDPDLYPNVDWNKLLLKDYTSTYRATLNISGGGPTVRYFASGSYYNQGGIYKDEIYSTYGKRTAYDRINFRLNTDINVTKTTILTVGIGGWVTSQVLPGMNGSDSGNFWNSISYMNPIAVPVQYTNGQYPTYGYSGHEISPYILLNKTGYQSNSENKIETNVGVRQDLGFITEGLMAQGRLSYDGYNNQAIYRLTMPDLYRAERSRDLNGDLITRRMITNVPLHQYSTAYGWRRTYGELQLNYDRSFGDYRLVNGTVLSDLRIVHDYGITDHGTLSYGYVAAYYGVVNLSVYIGPFSYDTLFDHGIGGYVLRRQSVALCVYLPVFLIEIEFRYDINELHIGLPIRAEGSDILPVAVELIGKLSLSHPVTVRDHMLSEIKPGLLGIFDKSIL